MQDKQEAEHKLSKVGVWEKGDLTLQFLFLNVHGF